LIGGFTDTGIPFGFVNISPFQVTNVFHFLK